MERRGLALALIICCCFHSSLSMAAGSVVRQGDSLRQMMASRRKPVGFQPAADWGHDLPEAALSATAKNPADFLVEQKGRSMAADKVDKLPGQPDADFDQYSGYITVDAEAGRALFYYFAESPQNTSSKPLVLWLNGGPRCSSLGFGAMAELGPFRPNSDGRSLSRNPFAWNNVANILFLESPAGIGFSYSNTTSDYKVSGDIRTAEDAYVFLVNWLERFPQYKTRDFYITGESYGGHYVPQLAATIIANNKTKHGATINLKGIAVGNAYFEDYLTFGGVFDTNTMAMYEYFWTHAMISDETRSAIITNCKYPDGNVTGACAEAVDQADSERGDFDIYNIYQPRCRPGSLAHTGLAPYYDPCTDNYVGSYLNLEEVQTALHARVPTVWTSCNLSIPWTDSAPTILPTLIHLIDEAIQLWIYSGDVDSIISVTSTRYTVNALKLPIKNPWRAWIVNNEVGGYVVNYKGLTFATVRGAGHEVPSYQPERALVLFTSFLKGGFS